MTAHCRIPFSFLPSAIGLDPRLSKRQLRMLIVLYSFRSETNGNVVWPSRGLLSELLGWDESRVSNVSRELVALGYLVKSGNGGRSRSVRYELTTPDLETVTETVTKRVTETVTGGVTETVTGIEQTKEQTKEHRGARAARRPALDWSGLPESARGEVLDDWMEHRKALRAPITTQTAINRLCAELRRCEEQGISAAEALAEAIDAGWRSVKVGWIKNRNGGSDEKGKRGGRESSAARVARNLDNIIRGGDAGSMGGGVVQEDASDLWEPLDGEFRRH